MAEKTEKEIKKKLAETMAEEIKTAWLHKKDYENSQKKRSQKQECICGII